MTLLNQMLTIFDELLQKRQFSYSEVHSRPIPNTTQSFTGYVHTLDLGHAIFISEERKPYLITVEFVAYYNLKTGDRITAKVNFSSEYNNYIVYEITDIEHIHYDEASVIKSNRSLEICDNQVSLGTSIMIPVSDNQDTATKVAQILPSLPADVTPILLSFDGRPTNFTVPTAYFTKPSYGSREKLMTCLLTFFYAKQQANVGKHIVLIIDSLDKMFTTFNGCMQPAGLIDPNLYSSAAIMDFENILCSSNTLQSGGSLTIIGLHQKGTSPQMLQINDRLSQIMDSVLEFK